MIFGTILDINTKPTPATTARPSFLTLTTLLFPDKFSRPLPNKYAGTSVSDLLPYNQYPALTPPAL